MKSIMEIRDKDWAILRGYLCAVLTMLGHNIDQKASEDLYINQARPDIP